MTRIMLDATRSLWAIASHKPPEEAAPSPSHAAGRAASPYAGARGGGGMQRAQRDASPFAVDGDTGVVGLGRGQRAPSPSHAAGRSASPFGGGRCAQRDASPFAGAGRAASGQREASPFGTGGRAPAYSNAGVAGAFSGNHIAAADQEPRYGGGCGLGAGRPPVPGGSGIGSSVGGGACYGGRVDSRSSNAYACGANQNCGNFVTDRRTTRVAAPPGGRSQISFG